MAKRLRPYKEVLGFKNGYITIFKGETYPHLDWFRESEARYSELWGWYFTSDTIIPEDLPSDITTVQLAYEDVFEDENTLKDKSEIKSLVDSLIYDPGESEWAGSVGERVDAYLTVTRAIQTENGYGLHTFHIFNDDLGNIYTWSTAAKHLTEGEMYHIRGTIKELTTYRNNKQTVLTRCRIV